MLVWCGGYDGLEMGQCAVKLIAHVVSGAVVLATLVFDYNCFFLCSKLVFSGTEL